MDSSLGKLIVSLAAMSEDGLRNIRREMQDSLRGNSAGELILKLIDLYINVGEDTELRAKAAAGLLIKLSELDDDDETELTASSSRTSEVKESDNFAWLFYSLAGLACFIGLLAML